MANDAIERLIAEEISDSEQVEQMSKEEIAELKALKAEVDEFSSKHGDWKSLKSEYVRKSQKLSEYEKNGVSKDPEVPSLDDETSSRDLAYLKKLGVITKEEYQEKVSSLEKKIEEKEEQEEVDDLKYEIDTLHENYSFVDPKELIEFMQEQYEEGTRLSPDKAAKLLYFDQFATLKARGRDLPTTDRPTRGIIEAPVPDKMSFQNQSKMKNALEDILTSSNIE